MVVVLGHHVSDEAGEVAGPVAVVQDVFQVLPFALVDQLQIVVLLIQQLPFHFVHLFLLAQNVAQNGHFSAFTALSTLFKCEPRNLNALSLNRFEPLSFGHFGGAEASSSCRLSAGGSESVLIIVVKALLLFFDGRIENFRLLLVFATVSSHCEPFFELAEFHRQSESCCDVLVEIILSPFAVLQEEVLYLFDL